MTQKRKGRPSGVTRPILPRTTVAPETLAAIRDDPRPAGRIIDEAMAALKRENAAKLLASGEAVA